MDKLLKPGLGKRVAIIGAPLGYGAGQVGSELGAEAIRLATFRGRRLIDMIGELGYDAEDRGNVEIVRPSGPEPLKANPRYLNESLVSCRNLADGGIL